MADFLDGARFDGCGDTGRSCGVRGITLDIHHVIGGKFLWQRLEVFAGLVVDGTCLRITFLIVEVILPHQSEQPFLEGEEDFEHQRGVSHMLFGDLHRYRLSKILP